MKTLKIIPIFCLLFLNCSGQQKNKESTVKPHENITVNKAYDEHGNLIRYDSMYSYNYASNGKLNDSIKMKFQRHFNSQSFFNDSFFDDFFEPDSLSNTFNQENFFFDGFMNQDQSIKDIMKRVDSIQELFF